MQSEEAFFDAITPHEYDWYLWTSRFPRILGIFSEFTDFRGFFADSSGQLLLDSSQAQQLSWDHVRKGNWAELYNGLPLSAGAEE